MTMRRILGAWSVCLALSAAASAQVRAGGEFRANTYTTGAQHAPVVAREPDGDFVIAWHSLGQSGGSGYDIFGQRYDASGAPRGGEFQINTYTTGDQYLPWVAADGSGRFAVVWNTLSASPDGDGGSVHGQRFAADGSRLGGEFIVNTYTTGDQYWARVSVNRAGDFVVVWQSYQDGSDTSVHGQRFDRTGRRLGGEFQINEATTGFQEFPDVKINNAGALAVAWAGPDGSAQGIFGRIFLTTGAPAGPEFRVNSYTTSFQNYPSLHGSRIVGNPTIPGFVVSWQSLDQDGSAYGVFARRVNGSGVPLGTDFQINAYTTGAQDGHPVAAMEEGGNFVVAWRTTAPQDGSGSAAMARRYSVADTPRSGEFLINTYTTGLQEMADAAVDQAGNFVVVWDSYLQDGSSSGVFGQRFGGLHARTLRVDTASGPSQDGNGMLEPEETVDVRPGWRNLNGVAQTFSGTLGPAFGPAGCNQSTVDGQANYGTVANGATAECTDCYTVSAAGPRCVQHWDARVIEALSPDIQGQAKDWALHIGDSFGDVPRTNPFYRFIETLLHFGVTGGCNASDYCPGKDTTREQMSVFVLIAKEGAGYAPPACTTPVFTDVPAGNPFCPFIEELFRRGVVSGCGGGNYCPGTPVTREQMAIFVLRTLDAALNPPACATPVFNDVPASSPFCRWIEELFRRGVVTGCAPGQYCPNNPVTREQMGVFITATFGLTLYGP